MLQAIARDWVPLSGSGSSPVTLTHPYTTLYSLTLTDTVVTYREVKGEGLGCVGEGGLGVLG